MKKFAIHAVAIAAGALAAGGALAGTITVPGGQHNFAVEALTSTTAVTTPDFVYNMGVGRPVGNGFTIIMTPSAGATFGTCVVPSYTGGSTVSVTLKRQSTLECAYDVQVATAAVAVGDTFTWQGQTFASHSLATAGNTIAVSINLKDPGETSQVDNSGAITQQIASSGNALRLTAAADTATKADVNDEQGPLFGFVSVGDDADAVAKAGFVVNNNTAATTFSLPDGHTPWDFTSHGTSIAVTVTGSFQGMAATNGFLASTGLGTAPTVTATAAGSTATFTLLPANIASGQSDTTVTTTFTSARTSSLGTSRTFGVSAVGDVQTGADVTLSGSTGWWVWGANASQLMTPYFNNNPNYITRFFLLNTSSSAVSYSVQCFTEGGGAVTNGTGGTLAANATTNIAASSVCTFPSTAPRGAVIFTINAPIERVKGTFNMIRPDGVSSDTTPLVRPYTQQQTTE